MAILKPIEKKKMKIVTPKKDGEAVLVKDIKFMVGDVELIGVTGCSINPAPGGLLVADLTVEISLGEYENGDSA